MSFLDSALGGAMPKTLWSKFGQPVVYIRGSTNYNITAILQDPPPLETNFPGTHTELYVPLDALPLPSVALPITPLNGDEVDIGPDSYRVVDVRMDPIGSFRAATLALNKT